MEYVFYGYPAAMIAIILTAFFGCKASSRFKKPLIIMCLAANGVYIIWRFGFTLPSTGQIVNAKFFSQLLNIGASSVIAQ